MRLQRATYIVVLITLITYVLYISQSYLIPLVLAFLIWDIIRGLRDLFTKINFVEKYFPVWVLNTLSFGTIFLVLSLLSNMIVSGIGQFSTKLPTYQANIYKINEVVLEKYNYNLPVAISNQKFNEYIKDVCEEAEIEETIIKKITKKKTLTLNRQQSWLRA